MSLFTNTSMFVEVSTVSNYPSIPPSAFLTIIAFCKVRLLKVAVEPVKECLASVSTTGHCGVVFNDKIDELTRKCIPARLSLD